MDRDQPENIVDIFLQPGDFYFGDKNTCIRTLLGSCVSITMWHPQRLIGGMCHYLLPSNPLAAANKLDGHYADEAMQLFMREIKAAKTRPQEYRVKLFGGGDMFVLREQLSKIKNKDVQYKAGNSRVSVSVQNVQVAYKLTRQHGFEIEAQDLGGDGHRHLVFDLWTGNVWVRKPTMIV